MVSRLPHLIHQTAANPHLAIRFEEMQQSGVLLTRNVDIPDDDDDDDDEDIPPTFVPMKRVNHD